MTSADFSYLMSFSSFRTTIGERRIYRKGCLMLMNKQGTKYKVVVNYAGKNEGLDVLSEARRYVYRRLVEKLRKEKGGNVAKHC